MYVSDTSWSWKHIAHSLNTLFSDVAVHCLGILNDALLEHKEDCKVEENGIFPAPRPQRMTHCQQKAEGEKMLKKTTEKISKTSERLKTKTNEDMLFCTITC